MTENEIETKEPLHILVSQAFSGSDRAEAAIGHRWYVSEARHGAVYALARKLRDAGVPDERYEVVGKRSGVVRYCGDSFYQLSRQIVVDDVRPGRKKRVLVGDIPGRAGDGVDENADEDETEATAADATDDADETPPLGKAADSPVKAADDSPPWAMTPAEAEEKQAAAMARMRERMAPVAHRRPPQQTGR